MRTNELRHKLAKPKTTYLHTIKQNDTTAQHTRKPAQKRQPRHGMHSKQNNQTNTRTNEATIK